MGMFFVPITSLSLSTLHGLVMKQAGILSYMDVFLYLGILFLACIPFILMVRENKVQGGPAAGMH